MNSPAKTSKYVKLDARHALEQEQLGQPRFVSGDYIVKVSRCWAEMGEPEIWLPEEEVTYFIVELCGIALKTNAFVVGHWVNRLRFQGFAQLKEFVLVATNMPWATHDAVTGADIEEIVGPTNPLFDRYVQLHVAPPKPGGYMHHAWKRMTVEQISTWAPLIESAEGRA